MAQNFSGISICEIVTVIESSFRLEGPAWVVATENRLPQRTTCFTCNSPNFGTAVRGPRERPSAST